MILFGGATGDTGKYIITGDTYGLDLINNKWSKLEGNHFIINFLLNHVLMLPPGFNPYFCVYIVSGIAPSPRAAHASCSVDSLQMVVYGGATGGNKIFNIIN